jgi:hypothetical protein
MIEKCKCGALASWIVQGRHQDMKPSVPAIFMANSCDKHLSQVARTVKESDQLHPYRPKLLLTIMEIK